MFVFFPAIFIFHWNFLSWFSVHVFAFSQLFRWYSRYRWPSKIHGYLYFLKKKIKSKMFWLLCVIFYTHILLYYILTNYWLLDMNRQWKITPFTVTTPPPPSFKKAGQWLSLHLNSDWQLYSLKIYSFLSLKSNSRIK